MKLRIALLSAFALTFACTSEGVSSAADQPKQVSEPTAPAPQPFTILPSREEIRAIPEPGQGRLVGYALNLHPGARIARRIFGR